MAFEHGVIDRCWESAERVK